MSDLEEAKHLIDYTIVKDDFLDKINTMISDLFAVTINFTTNGLLITFSNGQKFLLTLQEF